MDSSVDAQFDTDVRTHVYEHFLATARPPTHEQTAQALGVDAERAADAYRRLSEQRVLVLAPGTLSIWMANPLSAYPTPFTVETSRGTYWGTCIWDAFGIPAMLGEDATISTSCPDCGDRMTFRVREGRLAEAGGVAHFAVPARRWWENIGYT